MEKRAVSRCAGGAASPISDLDTPFCLPVTRKEKGRNLRESLRVANGQEKTEENNKLEKYRRGRVEPAVQSTV